MVKRSNLALAISPGTCVW